MSEPEKTEPTFVIRIMKNAFGQTGPILCWPDGTIVPAQAETSLTLPADGISSITVRFHIAVAGFIEDRTTDWVDPETAEKEAEAHYLGAIEADADKGKLDPDLADPVAIDMKEVPDDV